MPPTPSSTNTPAALAEFWDRYGAKENFPPKYVELFIKLLEAEDKVVDKDYLGARLIVDDLIKKIRSWMLATHPETMSRVSTTTRCRLKTLVLTLENLAYMSICVRWTKLPELALISLYWAKPRSK